MYQNKSRKIIEINPDLFTLKKTFKNKKEKKQKPNIEVKSNQVKKELLKKIKDYQKKNQDDNTEKINSNTSINDNINDQSFNDEFNTSLSFLQDLNEKKQNTKIKKQTLKKERKLQNNLINLDLPNDLKDVTTDVTSSVIIDNSNRIASSNNENSKNSENNDIIISNNSEISEISEISKISENSENSENNDLIISNNSSIILEEKPYGCLKSGNKPTFREWKRLTQKRQDLNSGNTFTNIEKIKIHSENSIEDKEELQNKDNNIIIKERQEKLQNIKKNFNNKNTLNVIDRHTKTTKYKLGKQGKHVSILIKNNTTRKNIKEDITKLYKKSIIEIKNYLKKHNLIKVGTNAPNDVLRQIYEQSILAGDIKNNSNFIYNYLES
jgi:hypothetical protein